MNDNSKWKRKTPMRIYDYNFKVGEAYYHPQTEYIDDRSYIVSAAKPPECQSYAERFVAKPWYGGVKGLPYDMSDSALSQPLVNRRAVSASRASSIMKDREDNVPPHIRTRRRAKMIEEEIVNDDKYKEKPRRYHFEEELEYKPSVYSKELRRDLEKLEEDIAKPPRARRSSISYDLPAYDTDLHLPGKKTVSKSEYSYTLPSTGTTVSKSSHVETKRFESKPPIGGARSRRISFNDSESSFELPPRAPRARKVSLEDFSYRPPKSLDSLKQDDYDIKVSAAELRDMRRAKESEDLSENIRKSIAKMRSHDIDKEAAYKYTRQMRSSSLDPFGDDSKYSAKQRATRFNAFVYGVGGSN